MIKSEILINDFYQSQKKFGYLESIKFSRVITENSCSDYSVEIVLCNCPFYSGDNKLQMSFNGARDIKTSHAEGLPKLFITIVDVSENQWEGIRFKVKEDENEQFSFYCNNFEFKIV